MLNLTKPVAGEPGLSAVVPTGTLIEAVPPTSRVVNGVVELIPTLPVEVIRSLSANAPAPEGPLVLKTRCAGDP